MNQSICLQCKKQFSYKSRSERGNPVAKFCSVPCRYIWQRENLVRYDQICNQCNISYQSKKRNSKFCSLLCHIGDYRPKRECFFCKNVFSVKERNDRKHQSVYCSKECRYRYENDPINQLKRLKESLDKNVIKRGDNECWGWKIKEERGYGQAVFMGKHISASKASYIVYKGEIPKGMIVCHSCDVPECTNFRHLWLGTYHENTQDMIKKGRNRNPKGTDHPGSKLTEEQIVDIKKRLSNGEKGSYIAQLFSISDSLVSSIKTKKKWGHI